MMKVGIIGYGRFGKLLASILAKDFSVTVYDKNITSNAPVENVTFVRNIEDIYSVETLFIAVPISQFESVIKHLAGKLTTEQTVVDVLSVKVHPKKIFEKYLPHIPALLTHPMFGPDSVKERGLHDMPLVIDKNNVSDSTYSFWVNHFKSLGLRVVALSARDHDKLAANSQGVVHFIGRLLQVSKFSQTPIDTLGAKKLNDIMQLVTNDTWELFYNLQNYNPYTKAMRVRLGMAYDALYMALLPERISSQYVVFGIQGGKGSFNELALKDYTERHNIKKFKVKYLYTTEKVLSALHRGDIDFGQFATHNSIGGIVTETIHAIAKHKFVIVEEFAIKIRHNLMKKRDVSAAEIDTIIAHDQVLKQCANTLKERYPQLNQITGKGDLLDTARAASAISSGMLQRNLYVLGNPIIADLFDFETVDTDLQDSKENYTSFLMVKR